MQHIDVVCWCARGAGLITNSGARIAGAWAGCAAVLLVPQCNTATTRQVHSRRGTCVLSLGSYNSYEGLDAAGAGPTLSHLFGSSNQTAYH